MLSEIQELIHNKRVAITGRAGSGKTTLARLLGDHYSIDSRFIGDSEDRKNLLVSKSNDIVSYIDACNQYNWWDWEQIERDLSNSSFTYEGYDRDTGENRLFKVTTNIVEGALLGPENILNLFDLIIFVHTPEEERFKRLVEKDKSRRKFTAILARFLITDYSESLYYKNTLLKYSNKIIVVDEKYDPLLVDERQILNEKEYIPIEYSN